MEKTVLETLEEMESIELHDLRNSVHREFIKDTLIKARECEAIRNEMPQQLQALEDAYEAELQASLIEEEYQNKTQEINQLADDRMKGQTALKSGFRAVMGMGDPEKVAVATALFELMHKYDLHAGMNVDEQTAVIDSFILDVEEHYLPQVELVGMTVLYNRLKEQNEAVCAKVIERDESKVGKGINQMRNCRLETDAAWRGLRRGVNAFSYTNDYAGYKDFIGYMNVLILRYKRVHLKQKVEGPEALPGTGGGSSTEEGGSSSEGGSTSEGEGSSTEEGGNTNGGSNQDWDV